MPGNRSTCRRSSTAIHDTYRIEPIFTELLSTIDKYSKSQISPETDITIFIKSTSKTVQRHQMSMSVAIEDDLINQAERNSRPITAKELRTTAESSFNENQPG